jgi:hypothetical protein
MFAWFSAALQTLNISEHLISLRSFTDVLRSQLAFRLEQFGTTAITIRFGHPYYEEAFIAALRRDPETRDAATSVLQVVTQLKPQASIRAVFRLYRRDPELGFPMLQGLVPIIKAHSTSIERLQFSLELISLLQGTAGDESASDLLAEICSIDLAFEIANSEQDLRAVGLAMKYCYTYGRILKRLSLSNKLLPQHPFFRVGLDWHSLVKKWLFEKKLANSLASLEWSCRMGYGSVVRQFVAGLSWEELSSRFSGLSGKDQIRFTDMIGPYRYEELRALSRNVTGDSDPGQVGAGQPRGKLVIDQGTAEALRRGRNLLPVGIIEVHGEFEQGDRIDLCDISRIRLGWGITHYSSDEIRAIKGLHSDLIGQTLGYTNGSTSIVPRHHLYLD